MAFGVRGATGAHALLRVALVHNSAVAIVTNRDQHMAASTALDRVNRRRNA